MTKNLLKASLWGILTLSLFYSCRTDSVTTEQNQQISEKIAAFERFEKANNIIQPKASSKNNASSEKYVSYAAPFSEVITNFLETHSDYRERLEKEIGRIRLDVCSTTFGEGAKGVLFPVTDKDGKVIGAWGGIVNEERDYVKFYYLNNSSQEVTSIKNAFQSYYDRNTGKLANLAIASKSASLNPIAKKATEIEEVVITVYKPLTYYDLPSWWHDAGWTDPTKNPGPGPGTTMEGGPGTHGGGTNGTENNNQQKDPCSGMKTQREDKGFKDGVTDLKGKTGLKKETGYTQNGTTGEYTYQENASATESSNSLRLPDAERYNVKSYLHTHVDDFSTTDDSGNEVTRTGIKMFSPADVIYMMDMLRNAKTRGIDFSDVSGTMVTSIGTYTLRFSGNEYQLKSFTFEQYQGYTTSYIDFMTSNTNLSLEQKFLQFIDTKMNVKGIELFKLNDDGTNTKISLNSDKSSVTTSNCPN